MTRKQYRAMAAEINERVKNGMDTITTELVIDIFSKFAKQDNYLFNREIFRDACYGLTRNGNKK